MMVGSLNFDDDNDVVKTMKNPAYLLTVDNSLNNYAIVYSFHKSISMTLLLLLPVLL